MPALGRVDNLHTSFKYRDEISEERSSLTMRATLRLHAAGSNLFRPKFRAFVFSMTTLL